MRPPKRRETGEQDLLRLRLDQIIDLNILWSALGRTVDLSFLEERFGEVYTGDPGRPSLPTRLMAGLAILKHTYNLSDEVLCERWVENPLLPVLLRRGVLPAPAGVRSLVADALAQPHERGSAAGAVAGEPVGCHQDKGDQAVRAVLGDRHHGSAQERDIPHRGQASERAPEKLVRLAQLNGVSLRQCYALWASTP
ncbi:hypothetical protein ACVWWO_003610 [Bradyrhizobium sp. F1.13.1]